MENTVRLEQRGNSVPSAVAGDHSVAKPAVPIFLLVCLLENSIDRVQVLDTKDGFGKPVRRAGPKSYRILAKAETQGIYNTGPVSSPPGGPSGSFPR